MGSNPVPYEGAFYHRRFNCILHVGTFVTIRETKIYSRDETGCRIVINTKPGFIGRLSRMHEGDEVSVTQYRSLFKSSGSPIQDPGDLRIAPVSDFPGSTLEELVEMSSEPPVRIHNGSVMIVRLPFVFSHANLKDPNISWISGMSDAYLLCYRYHKTQGFETISIHEPFTCDAHNDAYMPSSTKSIFLGLQEIYDTLQRTLNTRRGAQGEYKTISDRTRYHHNLAWKFFFSRCKDAGMAPSTTKFGYLKVLTLPGFVTKKVKMSRPAQQFTFSSSTDLDFLQRLIGAMVVFGTGGPRPRLSESNGIRISVGTRINVVSCRANFH